MRQGFIIPIYRHSDTAEKVAQKLSVFGLPIILVDDGNEQPEKDRIAEIAAKIPGTSVVTLKKNLGKGGAVSNGIKKAAQMGLTHAFQIDADGQHDMEKISFFLEESKNNPDKIICGRPEYDNTAPKSRIMGRKISNFWAAVTTLSGELKDVLCGFRVYPVDKALQIIKNPFIDKRMGFDPEIMVRLYWKKVFPVYHDVKVFYYEGGISNFNAVRDNVRISVMFTRLCLGMLIRLPMLIVLAIQHKRNKL